MTFDVEAALTLADMYDRQGDDRPSLAQAAIRDLCAEVEALRARLAERKGSPSRRRGGSVTAKSELKRLCALAPAEMAERLAKAEAENDRLRKALEWYADPVNHLLDDANGYYPDANFPIMEDEGKRAREALKESK